MCQIAYLCGRSRLKRLRRLSNLLLLGCLSQPEIDILQELQHLRTTDWLFESERKQRLSERSLHHIIASAGVEAELSIPVHPYMLRRTGLYYRAALLLQPHSLTLGECCLLWKCYATGISLSKSLSH